MNNREVVHLDLEISCGELDEAIEGFDLLLTEGYMAHGDDFNHPDFHRQVRATTYLMGLVRRRLLDHLRRQPEGCLQ